jgi:hypothetical protein
MTGIAFSHRTHALQCNGLYFVMLWSLLEKIDVIIYVNVEDKLKTN